MHVCAVGRSAGEAGEAGGQAGGQAGICMYEPTYVWLCLFVFVPSTLNPEVLNPSNSGLNLNPSTLSTLNPLWSESRESKPFKTLNHESCCVWIDVQSHLCLPEESA